MPLLLMRFLPWAVSLVLLGTGVMYYGHVRERKGAAKISALWEAERRVMAKTYDMKVAETARVEDELALATWRIERELKPTLEATHNYGRIMARKLLEYARSHDSAVPETLEPSVDPFGTGGSGVEPRTVDVDIGVVISACQRDAIRLNAWIEWWGAIPPELKQSAP